MRVSDNFFRKFFNCLLIILIALTAMLTANAQLNRVDSSFNAFAETNSISTTNFILQPDNKIIVFGGFHVVNGVINNSIARLNADGTLDNTFNCQICDFPVTSVVLQPDGKIIIGGETSEQSAQSRIYRLNADGSRDASFASPFPPVTYPESNTADVRAIQPDGKILVVLISRIFSNSFNYKLYRLNPNGTIDNTFTTINISSSSGGVTGQRPGKISLLPDGKIFIVTNSVASCPMCTPGNALLKRFNADGTVDTTFEPPSATTNDGISASINDFEVQSDGSIIIVGKFIAVNGTSRQNIAKISPSGTLASSFSTPFPNIITNLEILPDGRLLISTSDRIYRLSAEGVLDNSFVSPSNITRINNSTLDSTGRIFLSGVFSENGASVSRYTRLNQNGGVESSFTVSFGTVGPVTTIAAQADGKVIIAGGFIRVNGVSRVSMARINTDGSLDSTFNSGSGFSSSVTKIIVQPDGKILAGGYSRFYNGIFRPRLLRLNADGTIDETFSQIFDDGGEINAMVLLPDGKILVGGRLQTLGGGIVGDGLSRLNANGSFDTSFRPTFGDATIRSVVVQTDSKIMVGGTFSSVNGVNRTGLVRLNADGSLDASFDAGSVSFVRQIEIQADGKYLVLSNEIFRLNNNGTTDTSFQSESFSGGAINQILAQPDGSTLVVGQFTAVSGLPRSALARLKPDGKLDVLFFPIGANNQIRAIERQADGEILVGGDFTRLANTIRIGIARLIVAPFSSFTSYDYDGDGKSDVSVFRPSNGVWYLNQSANGFAGVAFGFGTDRIVPADYDGDGKTDVAVFRPSNGTWYLNRSALGFTGFAFGTSEDIPVPADYDGDGKADIAVFRPSNGVWYINRSSFGFTATVFGQAGDKPVAADYDGDGKADIAVFRNGIWYIERSRDHFVYYQFGLGTDKTIPADYDGDGKADIAVYRDGVWYVERSRDHFTFYSLGTATDIAVPADYDGDGKADIAVYRPSNGVWYLQRSQAGFTGVLFGTSEDKPTPNAFVR